MEINIESISLKNFFSFGNKETRFDFKNGFNLILGHEPQTDKRNGCGKTTLVSVAPSFALFGKTPKNVKQSDIINWKNKKNCEVSLTFSYGSDTFTIIRSLKPNNLTVIKNGVELPPPAHKTDFDSFIEDEILGLNYETFSKIILCNPNDSISIFNTPKAVKRKFLDQLFDLEVFTRVNESCNKKISSIKTKNLLFDKDIENIDNIIKIKQDEIKKLQIQSTGFLTNKKSLNNINDQLENYVIDTLKIDLTNQKYFAEENDTSSFSEKISKITTKIRNISNDISYSNKEIDEIDKKISIFEENSVLLENEKRFDFFIKIFDNKIEKFSELLLKKKKEIEELEKEKIVVDTEIIALEKKIKQIASGICPTCDHKIDSLEIDSYNDTLDNLKNKLNKLKTRIQNYKLGLEKYEKIISALKKKLKKTENEKNNFEIIKTKVESTKVSDDELQKYSILQSKIEKYKKVKIKLETLLNKINNLKIEKQQNFDYTIEKIKNIENKIKNYDLLSEQAKTLKNIVENDEKNIQKINDEINSINDEIKELNSNIKDLKQQNSKISSLNEYVTFIKKLCKDDNIKQFALMKYIPFLNTKANEYLGNANQGFYLKLDSNLDVDIKGPGISNCSFNNLSGGESKIVDLAMQLSFNDIAKIQARTFPNIFVADELLDTSVDETNLLSIINILKRKQINENLKMYIVSHRKEISDLKFDNVYVVVKENGFSTIKEF